MRMTSDGVIAEQARIFDLYTLPTRDKIAQAFSGVDEHALDLMRLSHSQFEVVNREFVDGLAAYVIERAQSFDRDSDDLVTVLEAGAGSGMLSYHLSQTLGQTANGQVQLIAVDSGKWGITAMSHVETLDYRQALQRYQPRIVITSWMPLREDWTQAMRDTPSVQEYILIGETGTGCSGLPWETWGNLFGLMMEIELCEDKNEKAKLQARLEALDGQPAPSEQDGFVMHRLTSLSELQTMVYRSLHSETVAFRREAEPKAQAAKVSSI